MEHDENRKKEAEDEISQEISAKLENELLRYSNSDDYDYSQHLRPITGTGIFIDAETGEATRDYSSSKTTNTVIYISGYSKAPRVASTAEEDEEDFKDLFQGEEEIEDNFVELANELGDSEGENDDEGSHTTTDEQFKKVLEEYQDLDIGQDDFESEDIISKANISGNSALDEILASGDYENELEMDDEMDDDDELFDIGEYAEDADAREFDIPKDEDAKKDVLKFVASSLDSKEGEEEEKFVIEKKEIANPDNWDCESIQTFSTTTSNRPGVIVAHGKKKTRKQREIPKNQDQENHGPDELDLDTEHPGGASKSSSRRGESKEEKRKRKNEVKEQRRQRRAEKKNTKELFNEERLVQKSRRAAGGTSGNTTIHIQ